MTSEEAIDIIKKYDIYGCGYCHQGGDEVEEAFDLAIKALEQTDTLDKIRAEIDSAKIPKNQMSFFRDGINCALQIIDKYKAESEENNGNG